MAWLAKYPSVLPVRLMVASVPTLSASLRPEPILASLSVPPPRP
jgi:hypothetical protein